MGGHGPMPAGRVRDPNPKMQGLTIEEFEVAQIVSEWIEILAIFVIGVAVVVAISSGLIVRFRSDGTAAFRTFKRYIARGLLIGLDLLIAADIINTVILEATLENVLILGLLVLIRTFLSWSLELEMDGRWPWQAPIGSDGEPTLP
jgi:uncharacterized membrane protein